MEKHDFRLSLLQDTSLLTGKWNTMIWKDAFDFIALFSRICHFLLFGEWEEEEITWIKQEFMVEERKEERSSDNAKLGLYLYPYLNFLSG